MSYLYNSGWNGEYFSDSRDSVKRGLSLMFDINTKHIDTMYTARREDSDVLSVSFDKTVPKEKIYETLELFRLKYYKNDFGYAYPVTTNVLIDAKSLMEALVILLRNPPKMRTYKEDGKSAYCYLK